MESSASTEKQEASASTESTAGAAPAPAPQKLGMKTKTRALVCVAHSILIMKCAFPWKREEKKISKDDFSFLLMQSLYQSLCICKRISLISLIWKHKRGKTTKNQ